MYKWEEWAKENVDTSKLYVGIARAHTRGSSRDPRRCRCGNLFSPANRNHVWCSATCRSKYRGIAEDDAEHAERPEQGLHQDDLPVLGVMLPGGQPEEALR